MAALETLHEDSDLKIDWAPYEGERLTISVCGLGDQETYRQEEEFPGHATWGGAQPAVFVIDKARSWFNAPGLLDRTVEIITALRDRIGASRMDAIGNSMGGFGAMALSTRLPVTACLAFNPQFTIDDRLLPDQRWREYKRNVSSFVVRSAAECVSPGTRYTIAHGGRGRDRRHYLRFPTGANIRHFIVPFHTHSLAVKMKLAGLLTPFVVGALDGDDAAVDAIMARMGAHLRNPGGEGERTRLWLAGLPTPWIRNLANRSVSLFAARGGA